MDCRRVGCPSRHEAMVRGSSKNDKGGWSSCCWLCMANEFGTGNSGPRVWLRKRGGATGLERPAGTVGASLTGVGCAALSVDLDQSPARGADPEPGVRLDDYEIGAVLDRRHGRVKVTTDDGCVCLIGCRLSVCEPCERLDPTSQLKDMAAQPPSRTGGLAGSFQHE